jgi:hypothetical protein
MVHLVKSGSSTQDDSAKETGFVPNVSFGRARNSAPRTATRTIAASRWWVFVASYVCCLLALSLSARIAGAQPEAPQPLRFTSEGTPDTQKLNLENILQGSIRLKFAGYAAGPLTVFDAKATVEQRRQGACTIDVGNSEADLSWATPTPGCKDLLAPLAHAQPTKLAIAKADSSAFAIVELSGPAKYAGPTTSINATFDKAKDSFDWTKAIPAYVKQVAPAEDCWVRLDSWQKLTCGAPGISPGNAQAALEAAWRRGDTLELFMQVIDAESTTGTWRRFPFTGQERKQPVPVQAPTSPLESRCQSVVRTTHVKGAFYAVCVDAMRAQQSFLVLSCDQVPEANQTCDVVGDVLSVRRDLLVYVWHDAETRYPFRRARLSVGLAAELAEPYGSTKRARMGGPCP